MNTTDEIDIRLSIKKYINVHPDRKNSFIVNNPDKVKELLDYFTTCNEERTLETFYKKAFLNGYNACKDESINAVKSIVPNVE